MPERVITEGLSDAAMEELFNLHEEHDGLTPSLVLEAAASPTSSLHDHFEWNDSLAASQWRLTQARQLISKVRIRIESRPEVRVRAYVSIEDGNSRRYMHASRVTADEVMREQHRRQLERQLANLLGKLRLYEEFSSIANAIDEHFNGTAET